MTTPCLLAVPAVEGLRNQQIAPLLKVVKSDPESSATLIRLTGYTLGDHPNGSLLNPIHISPSHSDRLIRGCGVPSTLSPQCLQAWASVPLSGDRDFRSPLVYRGCLATSILPGIGSGRRHHSHTRLQSSITARLKGAYDKLQTSASITKTIAPLENVFRSK